MVAIFAAKFQIGLDFGNSTDGVTEAIFGFVQGVLAFPLNVPETRFHKCKKEKDNLQWVIRAKLKERQSNPDHRGGEDLLNQAIKDLNIDFFLTEDFFVSVTIGALFTTVAKTLAWLWIWWYVSTWIS